MALMDWFRGAGNEPLPPGGMVLGLDLNATRIRGTTGTAGGMKTIPLDGVDDDLPLAIKLDRKPELSRSALGVMRKMPHLVASGWLPFTGFPRVWQAGRVSVDAAAAWLLAVERLKPTAGRFQEVSLAVPGYMGPDQVTKLAVALDRAKLPLRGTVNSALALVADRTDSLHAPHASQSQSQRDSGIIPMHPSDVPMHVVVVDIDDHAWSASLIQIVNDEARLLNQTNLLHVNLRMWKERLLNALSDRCIRLCRRDPRDSADAEQALWDQLDEALERIRVRQKVSLTVRPAHWFQDLILQPEEWDVFCGDLIRQCTSAVQNLFHASGIADPPHAVWLTHDATCLPGLRDALEQQMSPRTRMEALPPDAIAVAAARLADRRRIGELPKVHLDTMIPLPRLAGSPQRNTRTANTK